MEMAALVEQYLPQYMTKYGDTALPGQLKALTAISRCRTPASGELYVQCPDCDHAAWRPLSCGNRHCPKCQNHTTSRWIANQQQKLLPVPYFMATFTLPRELRRLSWCNQRVVYSLMFSCVASILKEFGMNPKHLGAEIGMTMVLHTNTRRLGYHPHVHAVIPGGGIDRRHRYWKKLKGQYLFNGKALATMFRGRFLAALVATGLVIPTKVSRKWVVHCEHVGRGAGALTYLSRYLYRGVISEQNIVANHKGQVTFKYVESKTKEIRLRTLPGEDFLQLLMQHVLPKGFRRVRDYGFLHGNAKKLRSLVQLILHVITKAFMPCPRPAFKCPCCKASMVVVQFRRVVSRPPG